MSIATALLIVCTPQVEEVLERWARAYESGRIALETRFDREAREVYGQELQRGGQLFRFVDSDRLVTHRRALDYLLERAQGIGDRDSALGALQIAAIGFDGPMFDPEATVLRELGHWTLLRTDAAAAWETIREVAAGRIGELLGVRATPVRVAAIRALGVRGDPVSRRIVEAQLGSANAQARLAAAEATGRMRHPRSIEPILHALRNESHSVVVQALLQALAATLKRTDDVDQAVVDRAMRTATRIRGRFGWRADVDIVELTEVLPSLESIPLLIDLLEAPATKNDKFRRLIAGKHEPLLRYRAWRTLRRLTGAILPEEPAAWRRFWAAEQSSLILLDRSKWRQDRIKTSSGFYGIPVVGREVAFVLDVSASMRRVIDRKTGRTRLDLAREQLIRALRNMPDGRRFRVITFARDVREWSPHGVRPTPRALNALVRSLDSIEPGTSSNLHAALRVALRAEQVRFGKESENPIDEVFVLSDGLPAGDGIDDPDQLADWVRDVNRYQQIRINTVLAGSGAGVKFLKRIAAENGGEYVEW